MTRPEFLCLPRAAIRGVWVFECPCVSPEVHECKGELSLGGLSAWRQGESVYTPSRLCMSGEHVRGICGWTHEFVVFFVCVPCGPCGKTRGVLIDVLGLWNYARLSL